MKIFEEMQIYDISQEVFSCNCFPGDPIPTFSRPSSTASGDLYNLTEFSMCAHNGTHVDAPFHFLQGGKTVDQLELSVFVGDCYVARHSGPVSAQQARQILDRAQGAERILIAGEATVTEAAAEVFARSGILLIGNESQTVGPEDAPMAVHKVLLGMGMVLLEGVRLENVPDGVYLLSAAPLNLGGAEGGPCRALLIDLEG